MRPVQFLERAQFALPAPFDERHLGGAAGFRPDR
jgi:hypothetical protein